MASPMQLSLKTLRSQGWTCAVVEQWIRGTDFRRDLFGFADILAIHPKEKRFLLVQVTVVGSVSARLKKAKALPALAIWLRTGGEFHVHGWGNKAGKSQLKSVAVAAESLADMFLQIPKRRAVVPKFQPARDLFAIAK